MGPKTDTGSEGARWRQTNIEIDSYREVDKDWHTDEVLNILQRVKREEGGRRGTDRDPEDEKTKNPNERE